MTKFQSDDVKYGIKLSGNDLVLTGKTDVTNKITFPSGQLTYTGSGLRYEKATPNVNTKTRISLKNFL